MQYNDADKKVAAKKSGFGPGGMMALKAFPLDDTARASRAKRNGPNGIFPGNKFSLAPQITDR